MDAGNTEQESTPQLSDYAAEEGGEAHAEGVAVQPPAFSYVCQVEACGTSLSTAYDKKCRTCAIHRKVDDVLMGGEPQRFCQKCSRFHTLDEFDEGRRNCRRQLQEHNRRQRRLRRLRRTSAEDDALPPRYAAGYRPERHGVSQAQIDELLAAAASSQPAPPPPWAPAAAPPPPAPAAPSMTLTDMLLLQQLLERIQSDYALQNKVAELLRGATGLGLPQAGGGGGFAALSGTNGSGEFVALSSASGSGAFAAPPAPPPPPTNAAWAAGASTHYPRPVRPGNGQTLEEMLHLQQALAAALGLPPPPPQPDNFEQK